jgi:hypothetical protein
VVAFVRPTRRGKMVSGIRDEVTSPTPRIKTEATTVELHGGGRNNIKRRRQGERGMRAVALGINRRLG